MFSNQSNTKKNRLICSFCIARGQGFPPQRIRRRSFASLSRSASDMPPAYRPTLPFSPLLLKRLKTRFCPVQIPFAAQTNKKYTQTGIFFISSGTGIRTPIDWTRTNCPTIRRSPNQFILYNIILFWQVLLPFFFFRLH